MPATDLEFQAYLLDLPEDLIASLPADVRLDLVGGAVAELVIQTERAKDHHEPDPDGIALKAVNEKNRQLHRDLRDLRNRRQPPPQPVSAPSTALPASTGAHRTLSTPRARRERTASNSSSGSSEDGEPGPESPHHGGLGGSRSGPVYGSQPATRLPGRTAKPRHISHGLLAALMMSPKPLTLDVLEALTSNLSPSERCELEASLPAALSSEVWQPIKAEHTMETA